MSFWKTFLHQLVDPSLRLVTPHGPGVDQSSFGSMIIPSKSDISCTPNNEDCLVGWYLRFFLLNAYMFVIERPFFSFQTILNGVAKLLQEIKTPKDLKVRFFQGHQSCHSYTNLFVSFKMPLKFSVAMTCLTLLSNCHRELCSSEQGDASKSRQAYLIQVQTLSCYFILSYLPTCF